MKGEKELEPQFMEQEVNSDSLSGFGWSELGNFCYKQELYEKAIKLYRKAIKIHPQYSDAFYNLSVALFDVN